MKYNMSHYIEASLIVKLSLIVWLLVSLMVIYSSIRIRIVKIPEVELRLPFFQNNNNMLKELVIHQIK